MPQHQPAYETIVVERPEPRIARIVMNRPEARMRKNLQMTYDLNAAFDAAVQDDAVKIIILAGSGRILGPGTICDPPARTPPGWILPRSEAGAALPTQRPWPLRPRAGDLSADHQALAQPGQADHRRSPWQMHRRRADAGLGLRPDRRQR